MNISTQQLKLILDKPHAFRRLETLLKSCEYSSWQQLINADLENYWIKGRGYQGVFSLIVVFTPKPRTLTDQKYLNLLIQARTKKKKIFVEATERKYFRELRRIIRALYSTKIWEVYSREIAATYPQLRSIAYCSLKEASLHGLNLQWAKAVL